MFDEQLPFNDGGTAASFKPSYEKKPYQNWNKDKSSSGGNTNWQKKPWGGNKPKDEFIGLYQAYVGTGNKDTPDNIISTFKRIAEELENLGYIARTGGMDGPDNVFEAVKNVELHLPWKGFNNKDSKFTFNSDNAKHIAKMFHTSFDTLKPAIQAMLAKNARLVLGKDLKSPAMFVICWSADGAETKLEKTASTGNVGHVIAIANAMRIPVFNFGKRDAESRLKNFLGIPYVKES